MHSKVHADCLQEKFLLAPAEGAVVGSVIEADRVVLFGEVAGGIVVMRSGDNAQATIGLVRARLQELAAGLPAGVEVVETYDRSTLIQRAVNNLGGKLIEEFVERLDRVRTGWKPRACLCSPCAPPSTNAMPRSIAKVIAW